ncbi:MAG TPA: protein kinase [Labilithrix sp.]
MADALGASSLTVLSSAPGAAAAVASAVGAAPIATSDDEAACVADARSDDAFAQPSMPIKGSAVTANRRIVRIFLIPPASLDARPAQTICQGRDTFGVVGERALIGGRYELGPAIGSGGFATVFRAHDRDADQEVAVKLVPPGFGSAHLAARLWGEAAALKRLTTKYVARVFDVGEDASGVWLVMELVDGVPLTPEALGRALFPHEVLRVARGLLDGLSAAHVAGVVHGDIKPTNILIPRTRDGLDVPKLIDFGLARATPRSELSRDLGESVAPPQSGVVLGTARYMAPEVLRGAEADARSDVYGVGLVLFELLGEGPLFSGDTTSDQLRARIAGDAELEGRVPPPLSAVLARMLARDPTRRYKDASEAHEAVVDLDTAPVSVVGDDIPPQSKRGSNPADPAPRMSSIPQPPPPVLSGRPTQPPVHERGSGHPSVPARPSSFRPPPAPKLNTLPTDGVTALRETIRHLDLAMLDALARRERGQLVGRVARGVALALRLELDAAALILEPLAMQSDIARAAGATVLAPRARRVTRARVDSDREDKWIDTIPAELGALLASLATALSAREDAPRDAARCARLLDRLEKPTLGESTPRVDAIRVTLRYALTAARVRKGELQPAVAADLVRPMESADPRGLTHFDRVVRALCAASAFVRHDDARAREELERAMRTAAESGTTLLEACAATELGKLLVEAPGHVEQGLGLLERASTFLAHGDAPTLEHEAEHHRAAALVMTSRWSEAIPHLRAAREAAHAERSVEREVLSAGFELLAHLALGDRKSAREVTAVLGESRIAGASGRTAAIAWVARTCDSLGGGDRDEAADWLTEARARAREAEGADAFVLVEILGVLFDAARGELGDVFSAASEIERFAQEHAFTAFFWVDVLRAVVERFEDATTRATVLETLNRLALVLGPGSRLARDRKTSAPPPP